MSEFVIINIGRNVDNRPMTISRWDLFHDEIERLLYVWADRIVGKGTGESEWEGVTEEFATWHAVLPSALLPAFRSDVAVVANAFDQESIAVVVSTDDALVPAWTDDRFARDPWSDAPVCPVCDDDAEWCPDFDDDQYDDDFNRYYHDAFPVTEEDWSHPGLLHNRGDR